MPVFLFPIAFATLAALPALVGIYWLRNRYRRQPVSSLMLWQVRRDPREGGVRVRRLRMPWLFFLELLALGLLGVAATGPKIPAETATRPVAVVLDDSYSMLAGTAEERARDRAADWLNEQLEGERLGRPIHLIAAGSRPRILGEPSHDLDRLRQLLTRWTCRSARAGIDRAIALGSALAGDRGRVLVVTDHAPDDTPDTGRLRWRAFGRPWPNAAIVSAVRSDQDQTSRVLIEVAALGDPPLSTTLTVTAAENDRPLLRGNVQLDAGQTRRFTQALPPGAGVVRATLGDDALDLDNVATLVPTRPPTVRTELAIADERLRESVDKALTASNIAARATTRVQLRLTDRPVGEAGAGPTAWVLRFHRAGEPASYLGPFVIDRGHPLAEGLALTGVVWGVGETEDEALPGRPVITAGNRELLSDRELGLGRHELHVRLKPEASTLTESADWPILLWNLLRWRARQAPGIHEPNVRLGREVVAMFTPQTRQAELVGPGGDPRELPVRRGRAVISPDRTGLHRLRSELGEFTFAVSTLSRRESDLAAAAEGEWGSWLDEVALRWEYRDAAWALLLAAVALLTLHMAFVSKASQGVRA